MKLLTFLLACSALATPIAALGEPGSIQEAMEESMAIQREGLERMREFLGPDTFPDTSQPGFKRAAPPPTITFSNPAAKKFFVDGTKIPDVNFDAGPSWSGLLPISADPNETRKLFFWFWPTNDASGADDLVFWTNGGPGCSSLEGFLQENGPISNLLNSLSVNLWTDPTVCSVVLGTIGTYAVISFRVNRPNSDLLIGSNQFSWTNLAHVLWVEQPVGTGFSQGTPNITNDDQLAEQLTGFFEQFLNVFTELKGKNFYLSGESYAGFYVPYIANWIYEHPGLELNLKGIWIADPSLSWNVVQEEIPALRFVQANKNLFPFNSTFMAQLQNISDSCGYTDYLEKFVTYPPAGQLPFPAGVPAGSHSPVPSCRIFNPIQRAIQFLNPAFDIYRVSDTWPVVWSVLGFPRSTQQFIYFNRTNVQDAIHAPHIEWDICSNIDVYVNPTTGGPGGDLSLPSTLSVLPNVIEKSVRTVIVHGLADMILIAEGTRIAIQNMTWGGAQGFQSPIEDESFRLKDFGVFGNTHTERNLTYVEFYFSGHMTPQFVPWAAFSTMSYLLGRQDSVSTA